MRRQNGFGMRKCSWRLFALASILILCVGFMLLSYLSEQRQRSMDFFPHASLECRSEISNLLDAPIADASHKIRLYNILVCSDENRAALSFDSFDLDDPYVRIYYTGENPFSESSTHSTSYGIAKFSLPIPPNTSLEDISRIVVGECRGEPQNRHIVYRFDIAS